MITSVRFPTPITLVKNGNPHTEWAPGKDGVREIRREDGVLVFAMEDGTERETCLCGGMVLECRGGDPFVTGRPFVGAKAIASPLVGTGGGPSPGLAEIASEARERDAMEAKRGPASSPPSADPPPARPIRKGR